MTANRSPRMRANGAKLSLPRALRLYKTAIFYGKPAESLAATIWVLRNPFGWHEDGRDLKTGGRQLSKSTQSRCCHPRRS